MVERGHAEYPFPRDLVEAHLECRRTHFDEVEAADENGEGGLGFTFQSYNADDFFASLKRCLGLYNHNREAFRALQKRDMEKDFSWDVPAGRYMEQFRNMLSW